MKPALSVSQLQCGYQQQTILDRLSLDVEAGEIVCLLGASGCGKTTLLKAIAGLMDTNQGTIHIDGQAVNGPNLKVEPEHRQIGMIFQDYALFPHLNVGQNIGFGLRHWSKQHKRQRITEMLSLVHLDGLEDRFPHQLSGGQQQRVAIARALAYQPKLLLLDEPFSNIDNQVRHELIGEIRQLFKAQGMTAILVTHSREEAFAFGDKIAVMNQGKIEHYGHAAELYHRPNNTFVAEFLGACRFLPAKRLNGDHFVTELGTLQAQALAPIAEGESGLVLLRPHQVTVSADNSSAYRVVESQFTGENYRVLVSLGEQSVIATTSQPLPAGQLVSVSLNSSEFIALAS